MNILSQLEKFSLISTICTELSNHNLNNDAKVAEVTHY